MGCKALRSVSGSFGAVSGDFRGFLSTFQGNFKGVAKRYETMRVYYKWGRRSDGYVLGWVNVVWEKLKFHRTHPEQSFNGFNTDRTHSKYLLPHLYWSLIGYEVLQEFWSGFWRFKGFQGGSEVRLREILRGCKALRGVIRKFVEF